MAGRPPEPAAVAAPATAVAPGRWAVPRTPLPPTAAPRTAARRAAARGRTRSGRGPEVRCRRRDAGTCRTGAGFRLGQIGRSRRTGRSVLTGRSGRLGRDLTPAPVRTRAAVFAAARGSRTASHRRDPALCRRVRAQPDPTRPPDRTRPPDLTQLPDRTRPPDRVCTDPVPECTGLACTGRRLPVPARTARMAHTARTARPRPVPDPPGLEARDREAPGRACAARRSVSARVRRASPLGRTQASAAARCRVAASRHAGASSRAAPSRG
jgi:hypothetical protein